MVSSGQEVMKGGKLLEIEPSPDTHLQFEQAVNAYESAKQDLEHRQQLFNLKLATNKQVLDAKQALNLARSNLQSLKKRGVDGRRNILAHTEGLIRKVFVQEGAIVPAGAPLAEIISQNRLEARLGGRAGKQPPGETESNRFTDPCGGPRGKRVYRERTRNLPCG